MSDRTKIEWTRSDDGTPGATWNPVTGCTKLSPASPGCQNCYASTFAERFRGTPGHYFEHGFDVQLRPDKLDQPLRWRRPRRIFVNSMADLFHDQVPDEYIAKVWAVMAAAPRHTFQVLTKRHARMRSLLNNGTFFETVADYALEFDRDIWRRWQAEQNAWPLPNVWLGVSTENQQWADIRIPALLDTPAVVRFISAEPLLGPVELIEHFGSGPAVGGTAALDWVIVGGESGPGARPMHPDWARSLRDQCALAGVPFLFKQWGEWAPFDPDAVTGCRPDVYLRQDGSGDGTYYARRYHPGVEHLRRVGKKAAGRELDGRTWDEYPGVADV
ncbi:phage Gp37/Gp68 family protein [Mycolicibacterium fortuitum]|uniref:DUF5131 family protein n=1 Tax=Mycolicibacterium fortuitum TaxID=1766 RepID=UPI00148F7968|nr:phage Gp37/Gp68 family protein [Mycolicibacterium fortuitum]